MTVTEVENQAAHTAGRMAARTGMPVTVCPFEAGGDGRQKVLALWFVRGYRSAEPPGPAPE